MVGVRNVKWVGRVVASTEEAEGPWQRGLAYKGFSPMVKARPGAKQCCSREHSVHMNRREQAIRGHAELADIVAGVDVS